MQPRGARIESRLLLRTLMDPSASEPVQWSVRDMRAMLEHQLATPLVAESERVLELCAGKAGKILPLMERSPALTFFDVLRAASPIELLTFIKEFAKSSVVSGTDLPRDVARILYVVAILCGTDSNARSITSLDDASIEREARWCLSIPWLPEDLRHLVRRAIQGSRAERSR